MGMIKNVTESIYPYQQAMLNKFSGGFKHGEMMILSAGRQSGKSMITSYYYSALKKRSITTMATNWCNEILLPMKPAPKYKFSRSKWYEAEFNWGKQTEVLEWCTQQFGPQPKNPDAWSRWCHRSWTEIHFRDEKDYAWFMLRWS